MENRSGAEARESSSQGGSTPAVAGPLLGAPGGGRVTHGVCDGYQSCQQSQEQGEPIFQALALS